MFDPYEPGLEGAAQEIIHCAYPDADVTWTTDVGEALRDAAYIVTSGGAPRKEGMTREDLLLGNCAIARKLGEDILTHAPGAEFVVVVFNPADITGLVTLVYSGLPPQHVTTLAALDSTRLRGALAAHFGVMPDEVAGCATYGGHGEKMAVFKTGIRVCGVALAELLGGMSLGGRGLSPNEWERIKSEVRDGGGRIIKLRGRSSFQSPAHQSVCMLRARIECSDYPWPCGAYFGVGPFAHVMMAAPVAFSTDGMVAAPPRGDAEDMMALEDSYRHICALRDEVIRAGVLPPVGAWSALNSNL
jgi:malate dehydrogenase